MNTTCPKKNTDGFTPIVLIAVIALIAIGGVVLYQKGAITIPGMPTATEEPRINPAPTSGYAISVGDVKPAGEITIDSVEMTSDGYVVVMLDGKTDVVLGKSTLLTAGKHDQVVIKFSKATKDGDVVVVKLQDKNGKDIMDANKTAIEVTKNVGTLMMHYSNEY